MSTWTFKENAKLIQKVNELGTKWTSISKFFVNKSPPSLKMQYSRLKKKEEIDSDGSKLIENSQNNIRNILQKHLTRNDKINQLTIYESSQVFQEIIKFSIDFLSYLLMDLFDHPNFSKNTFLDIIKQIECKTLLQFCRTFSIIKDIDLEHIDYIQSDNFFFSRTNIL